MNKQCWYNRFTPHKWEGKTLISGKFLYLVGEKRGGKQMNLERLFKMQKQLDDRIKKEHQLEQTDVYEEKVLALLVELGELANETRCFKYWSQKGPSERTVILEEYVDGVHFILSLGIEKGWTDPVIEKQMTNQTMTQLFLTVYECVLEMKQTDDKKVYDALFTNFLSLGKALGFTKDEIVQAYLNKNEKNHVRQDEGY